MPTTIKVSPRSFVVEFNSEIRSRERERENNVDSLNPIEYLSSHNNRLVYPTKVVVDAMGHEVIP